MSGVRTGFGLVEAAAAVVVIGAVGVASMAAMASQDAVSYQVRRRIEAAALAEFKINEIGLIDRAALQLTPQNANGQFDPPFNDYTWSSRIQIDSQSQDLFTAAVTVRWLPSDSVVLNTAYRLKD